MGSILMDAGYDGVPSWDNRAVLLIEEENGQAILGTIYGSSTAWMLIQHKKALGLKRIKEVAVFTPDLDHKFADYWITRKMARMQLRSIIEDI
ncbi:hypothetical protein CTA2_6174 [Colletotrichum tanaceti]|uniref:Uncharacterized protein n=1 Tax=Colletotrichum tanaceti TaxID=1306861 RepID=A0A4U6XMJ4_9PEZI|nr:hypothetical protein CTA2_6174 [Colletotrichum tanaceti]TKW56909.1 hypothetical protein CTA1_5474 [Colletotrichum tanaceti]